MQATSFLLGVLLILGAYEVCQATLSSAQLNLNTLNQPFCDPINVTLSCLKLEFRTFDGTCNNLCNTSRGSTGQELQRFPGLSTPTAYTQPGFQPRINSVISGKLLPNCRTVSTIVFNSTNDNVNNTTPDFTHITMTWGQFLDHDLTLTAFVQNVDCGVNNEPCPIREGCTGIDILPGEELSNNQSAQCIPLRRSFQTENGEQINEVTTYLDGSQVYGSDDVLAEQLRDQNDRKLLDTRPFKQATGCPILPAAEEEAFCRSANPKEDPCFLAGDIRVNENQALMAMHTLWVSEHNRIAKYLHEINPFWDDERVFQTARKIVAAELQHITYNEWLAVLFDQNVRANAGIELEPAGQFFEGYDPAVNPEMFNSFSTAALRMGHTLIRNFFRLFSFQERRGGRPRFIFNGFILTREFFNAGLLFLGRKVNFISNILLGLVLEDAQLPDANFVSAVRERLIIEGETIDGVVGDLPAINCQRGRDHGLPGYTQFLAACGGGSPTLFPQLRRFISEVQVDRLKNIYAAVRDIDLWSGGISEFPAPGSALGFTFTCIITKQFYKLRKGDRFWYERNDPYTAFTLPQLTEIRKSTLSRVLCDNTDGVYFIQRNAFRPIANSRELVDCDFLPRVNLEVFKDEEGSPAAVEDKGIGGEAIGA
ncbi:peroxidasin homolog [Oculina patagonica]